MKYHLRPASRLAIASTVLALLLAACSSNPSAPAASAGSVASQSPLPTIAGSQPVPPAASSAAADSPAALDACSLLTDPEIEAATDYEVVGSNPDPTDGLSDCEWKLAGDGGTIGLRVELDSPRAQQDHEFNCKAGFGLAALNGVGDSACGDPIAGGTYLLYALQDDDQVSLRMQANYLIDKSAWATLAKAALARLP